MTAIYNQAAYDNAVHSYIIMNAQKTFYRTYPDAGDLVNFIASQASFSTFYASLYDAFNRFGKLTEKQVMVARAGLEKAKARIQKREEDKQALNANRQWLGQEGEKLTVDVAVRKIIPISTVYGTSYIFIFEDEAKNVLIYRGNSKALYDVCEGDSVKLEATVGKHSVRDGVKQTIIQRPKLK